MAAATIYHPTEVRPSQTPAGPPSSNNRTRPDTRKPHPTRRTKSAPEKRASDRRRITRKTQKTSRNASSEMGRRSLNTGLRRQIESRMAGRRRACTPSHLGMSKSNLAQHFALQAYPTTCLGQKRGAGRKCARNDESGNRHRKFAPFPDHNETPKPQPNRTPNRRTAPHTDLARDTHFTYTSKN